MSWASHDLEPYVIQRHLGRRVAIVPLIVGSYAPDLATKWIVYGTSVFGTRFEVASPAHFHRGWPGAGFTHAPLFGVVLALAVLALTRNHTWALSFLVGHWAHAFTDAFDTLGTMLLFPFTTHLFAVGLWRYTGADRFLDAGSYFSGPGFVWDAGWLVLAVLSWRVLTREYFLSVVAPGDLFWRWAGRRLPETTLLVLYRASFVYGAARWLAWLLWAHVLNAYAFDVSFGGPHWLGGVTNSELNAGCSYCRATPLALALGGLALAAVTVVLILRLARCRLAVDHRVSLRC